MQFNPLGCVILQKKPVSDRKPSEQGCAQDFQTSQRPGGHPKWSPPTSSGLICNPGSRVCHLTKTGLRKPSQKGCAQDFQTSKRPGGHPKWSPPTTGCPKKNWSIVRFWVFDLGRSVFRGNFSPENFFVLWNFLGVYTKFWENGPYLLKKSQNYDF